MNRKKKLATRITAAILCAAIIITAANWDDIASLFIKDISATEEMANEEKGTGSEIVKFNNKEIEVKLSTVNALSSVEDYLPKKINVTLDNGEEAELTIPGWKFYAGGGLKDGKYSYVYEMETPDGYTLKDGVSTPVATVYVNESSVKKDIIVDNGVYSIEAKSKGKVCPECFRKLDEDGLCNKCHDKDCACDEIDIDLKNMDSIMAFGKKYIKGFNGFLLYAETYRFDPDWIRSLPKNQREVIDTLCRVAVYQERPELFTYIGTLTAQEFLDYINNNMIGLTFEQYIEESGSDLTYQQYEEIAKKAPKLKIKDAHFNIVQITEGFRSRENISKKEEKVVEKIADEVENAKKTSSNYSNHVNNFSCLNTSVYYNIKFTTESYLHVGSKAKCSLGYSEIRDEHDEDREGPYARYWLRSSKQKNDDSENADDSIKNIAFCGNHNKQFAGTHTFGYIGERNLGTIGSILNYLFYSYPELSGADGNSNGNICVYQIAQSVIWNYANDPDSSGKYENGTYNPSADWVYSSDIQPKKWSNQTEFKESEETEGSNITGLKPEDSYKIWCLFRYGGDIGQDGQTLTIKPLESALDETSQSTNGDKTIYNSITLDSENYKNTDGTTTFKLKSASLKPGAIEIGQTFYLWKANFKLGDPTNEDKYQPMLTPTSIDLPVVNCARQGDEIARTRMVVRHNINNFINPNTGKGVIARWKPDSTGTLDVGFKTGVDTIKGGRYALAYPAKKYDQDSLETEMKGGPYRITPEMTEAQKNDTDFWKKNEAVVSPNDTEGKKGLVGISVINAYLSSFATDEISFLNYYYSDDDDSDYQEMINAHIKKCTYCKAKKNKNKEAFDTGRTVYAPYSSHSGYVINTSAAPSRKRTGVNSNEPYSVEINENEFVSAEDIDKGEIDEEIERSQYNLLNTEEYISNSGEISTKTQKKVYNKLKADAGKTSLFSFGNSFVEHYYFTFNGTKNVDYKEYKYNLETEDTTSKPSVETINNPETLKHKLVLHYQGGYVKSENNFATIASLKEEDKTKQKTERFGTSGSTIEDATYDKIKETNKDLTTIETVGSVFTNMTCKDYPIFINKNGDALSCGVDTMSSSFSHYANYNNTNAKAYLHNEESYDQILFNNTGVKYEKIEMSEFPTATININGYKSVDVSLFGSIKNSSEHEKNKKMLMGDFINEGARTEIPENTEETTGKVSPASGSYKFTYSKIDGAESVVDFNYEGDYVASLPTPSRYGYNFLGWYEQENAVGRKIEPLRGSDNQTGYNGDVIVLDNDKMTYDAASGANDEHNNDTLTLYAAWELITKDQTFYIDWMDNDNKYATRPDSVYIQLYRRAVSDEPSDETVPTQVTKFVTERINGDRFENVNGIGDWVTQFSNETDVTNQGGGEGQESNCQATRSIKFGRQETNAEMIDPNEYIKTTVSGLHDELRGVNSIIQKDADDHETFGFLGTIDTEYNNTVRLSSLVKKGSTATIVNPYKAFNGDGKKYEQTSYMKISLYKDKNSTAYNETNDKNQIDITGDNKSPSNSNQWKFTLHDLQKFKTTGYENGTSKWKEYNYTIKQIYALSKDYTVRYVTSPSNIATPGNQGNASATQNQAASDNDDSPARYGSRLQNYYSMDARNVGDGNSSNNKDAYNSVLLEKFGNSIINRIANIYDEPSDDLTDEQKLAHTFKNVQGTITFQDGTDKFHFRPYSMVVDLYQNISSNRGGPTSDLKDQSAEGVREIIQSKPVIRQGYPYSSIPNQKLNTFSYKFEHVPTLQEETGLKYGYDVILTHNQKRYRYTINSNDASDNFFVENRVFTQENRKAMNEFASYVHPGTPTTIVDVNIEEIEKNGNSGIPSDRTIETGLSDAKSVLPVYQGLPYSNYTITSQSSADTKYNGIIGLDNVSPTIISANGKINQYALNNPIYIKDKDERNYQINYKYMTASNTTATSYDNYTKPYSSMRYNLRYYLINDGQIKLNTQYKTEVWPKDEYSEDKPYNKKQDNNVNGIAYYYNISVPTEQGDVEVRYKETLNWNFTVTLQGDKMPSEYTGSESPDDRSGIYKGDYNSDFTHTVNTVKIKSNVFADDKALNDKKNDYPKSTAYDTKATKSNYDRLAAYKACEGFLLTFRQTKKTWTGTGDDVKETYSTNESPLNGKRINKYTNENKLYDQHMSFAEFTNADKTPTADCTTDGTAYEATPVGNEYNVIVPAEGEVDMLYLPDGKYEITCHEDIDFHSFSFMDAENGNKTTKVTEEDGRWFITFSSTSNETTTSNPDRTNSTNIDHKAEIDYWRGHNDDAANIAFNGNNQIDQTYNDNVLKNNINGPDSTYGIDTANPHPSLHRPTTSIGSADNYNYKKFNNVTQGNTDVQGNGFQINTWRENKDEDKTDAPLQYNNYVLSVDPKTPYGTDDEKAFKKAHNYDTFYIGSHSWAEIKENIMRNAKYNEDLITEKGQEPYGINSDANKSLYDGTSATVNSKPNVTGPKDKNWDQPISDSDKRSKYTGIVRGWKSSIAQSSTNGSYTKPATK